ncbi:MAG: tRNA uridine-5-carboxymethylaminomethyl(34) synthesis GTPase MnmE, partial [bacterium]
VFTVYRAPVSYTGEDSVEVSCHGSLSVVQACLEAFQAAGFRPAGPGEFTLRAFLAGKIGLTQAEAVAEIVRARTRTASALALGRLAGRLEQRIEAVKQSLVRVLASVEIQLDYPEEDTGEVPYDSAALEHALEEVLQLAGTFRTGSLYQEGVQVALAGMTNAGKSSLFNALLREDRSIVSDVHGTTRDYIEAAIDVGGIPVKLFDTAGLREVNERVEGEGIRRSGEIISRAAAVVYLVDASAGLSPRDEANLASFDPGKPVVKVWNKVDLLAEGAPVPEGYIPASVEAGSGLGEILDELFRQIATDHAALTGEETVVDSIRQHDLLRRAADALERTCESVQNSMPADIVAVDLQDAIAALGEITGEVSTDDVLETMFGGFCVGK